MLKIYDPCYSSRVLWSVTIALTLAFTAAFPAHAGAQDSPMGDGFAQANLKAYLQSADGHELENVALVKEKGIQGKAAIRIEHATSVELHDVPVEPDIKYTLKLRARYQGSEAIEENPLFESFLCFGTSTDLVPQREIQFLDAARNKISSLIVGMAFRQWHAYEDVFYTPTDTAYIRLLLASGQQDIVLFVDDIKLERTPDEGAINCNPLWSERGPFNYSGWRRMAAGGKIVELEDGQVLFDAQYGSSSQLFPMREPGEYEMRTVVTPRGYSPAIMLNMVDAHGKPTGQVRLGGISRQRSFILPPGTTHASFNVRSVMLKELRVVRLGNAPDVTP